MPDSAERIQTGKVGLVSERALACGWFFNATI